MRKKQIEMSVKTHPDKTQRASLVFHEPGRIDLSVLQGQLVLYAYLGTKTDLNQEPDASFIASEFPGEVDIKHTVDVGE